MEQAYKKRPPRATANSPPGLPIKMVILLENHNQQPILSLFSFSYTIINFSKK